LDTSTYIFKPYVQAPPPPQKHIEIEEKIKDLISADSDVFLITTLVSSSEVITGGCFVTILGASAFTFSTGCGFVAIVFSSFLFSAGFTS
jgi:hypothetical protein